MNTFEETGLVPEILKAVAELGYKHPTPIQEQVIPVLLETNRDLLGLAQTGTGKTAAFGLPLMQLIDTRDKNVQAIILCPTRELCRQITQDLENFAKYLGGVDITAVYGGANIQNQISSIKRGCGIVVGTPGRVIDLIERRVLKLDGIKYLVLDEADEMLNMGFKDDLDTILSETPAGKQTFLFSATMPKEVARIADKYLDDPVEISTSQKSISAENIEHQYFQVAKRDRYLALKRIADSNPDIYGIVFCRTRRETQEIADRLIQDEYSADSLHGDLSQAQRDHVMARFKNKNLQILVATDVAARGIDVNDITHVIHYNLPDDPEVYVHRSGRTARAGKKGISIALIASDDSRKLSTIRKLVGGKMTQQQIPSGKQICEQQLYHLAHKITETEVSDDISEFMPVVEELWADLDREALIKKVLSAEFNRFLSYYRGAVDLNDRAQNQGRSGKRDRDGDRGRGRDGDRGRGGDRDRGRDRNDRNARTDRRDDRPRGEKTSSDRGERKAAPRERSNDNFDRYFISLGSKDQLNAQRLMGFINEHEDLSGASIGRIEILKKFSFFEIDKKSSQQVARMNGSDFRGAKVMVEPAEVSYDDIKPEQRKVKKKTKPAADAPAPRARKPKYASSTKNAGAPKRKPRKS